jgi:putative copper resistance protein D
MVNDCLILARAVHIGACLLAFALFAFDRFVAKAIKSPPADFAADWQRRLRQLNLICVVLILFSGAAWFVLVAMTMSGLPLSETLKSETLGAVWNQTQFGALWKFRLAFWFAALAGVFFLRFARSFQKLFLWLELLFNGLLLGSLAWAGHGQEGQSAGWHLSADIIHLLVAAVWPAGLLPLILCLRQLSRQSDASCCHSISILVNRFSALSLASVVLLIVTGWVNSWYLVGSFANLFHQPYGQWLVAKLILFGIAVAIGAVNLLRLKPRLAAAGESSIAPPALRQLRLNVFIELVLATAIVAVVAILGILPPAAH